ncbi:hypothetical protein SAY87_019053 [Trapa incisa]|uniref:U1-type domain-containing protein n=1 Tax=Trapa incisa TaxID=236973 RepID=A0AAN7K1V2_9MYRT|nr:hypothetical protein SAY87_019053 [Trapa incisa]
MVWFQCEDCGENLKKPKLPTHFRICSATKLSCIDCGEIFGQQNVQGHNQCITEAEKYGPKSQSKVSNGTPGKQNSKDPKKQQPEIDIKVGLSSRPPWFCSLCNTKATSEQTLLLHADGKKHRAKARAFHASKQPPPEKEHPVQQTATPTDIPSPVNEKILEESKVLYTSETIVTLYDKPGKDNGTLPEKKKRKRGECEDAVVQSTKPIVEKMKDIKWKKLVKSALKSNPDKAMKMKKLKKIVIRAVKEKGIEDDENVLAEELQQKLDSCSRFMVEGKYVRLA